MNRFIDFCEKHTENITKNWLEEERDEMKDVNGMYDDYDGFQDNVPIIKKAIMGDVMNDVVLQDEKVQKIDLALEKIMENGIDDKEKKSKLDSDSEADEDEDEDDGNEWND